MEIYKLKPEEWQAYKNLRLEALQKDPMAFGASYEESVVRVDDECGARADRFFSAVL